MDAKQCMIVDLERRGDKRMFITEQVASISENKSGLWTVQFLSSSRCSIFTSLIISDYSF